MLCLRRVMFVLQVDKQYSHYTRNKAGLFHSHQHGFGLMDAWRMVAAARVSSRTLPRPPTSGFREGGCGGQTEIPENRNSKMFGYAFPSILYCRGLFSRQNVHVPPWPEIMDPPIDN